MGVIPGIDRWPATEDDLIALQLRLKTARPPPWQPEDAVMTIGACFVCFPRPTVGRGNAADEAWAASTLSRNRRVIETRVVRGQATAPYRPGLLALREGPVLEQAVRALPTRPDVLLVNATGRDHPRRAGLALHLGAVLGLPSIGVTHRPLLATGSAAADERGATAPLMIDDEIVGCWLRTRPGTRPLAVDPGWRMDVETAVRVVLASVRRARTPEPLRRARRAARRARADGGRGGEWR
jgi:deoxyribonuclease V